MYCRGIPHARKVRLLVTHHFDGSTGAVVFGMGGRSPRPGARSSRGHPGPRGRHGGDARAAEFDSRHARHRPISSHQGRDSLPARACDLPPSGSWEARHPQIGNLHFRQWRLLERWRELAAASAGDRLAWISRHRAGQNPQWSGCHGVAHGGPASAQESAAEPGPLAQTSDERGGSPFCAGLGTSRRARTRKAPIFRRSIPTRWPFPATAAEDCRHCKWQPIPG